MHMYTEHFNLNQLPFENVPDPLFFYGYGNHALVRKQISGSLQSGRGLIVVIGPIGSGKTTLSQMVKFDFPDHIKVIWMGEPPATSANLFLFIAQELGLQPESSEKTFIIRDLRNALLKINAEGKKCLIIMDESHLMSDDVINGIRLLNNLEVGSIKLIQLLLLGQEELMEKINRPEMEPFKQRIATLEVLGKMSVDTVLKYISHRIRIAGGAPELISDTGWEALAIAFSSGGTPRTINSLCDRSFNVAFERDKPVVDARDVYEATQRMGLVTDVFHYICLLNTREKEIRSHRPPQPTAERPAPKAPSPSDVRKTEQKSRDTVNKAPDISRLSRIKRGIAKWLPIDQKDLKLPMVLLLVSLVALTSSILFFYHRAPIPMVFSLSDGLIHPSSRQPILF